VLLIHGYGCNSGYWRWMSLELRQAHITHYALDMEPVFGSIDEYAPLVHAAVQRVQAETGQKKIVIVAHSMGGLAARAYLRDHGCDSVARVITLGSPHHGTAIANFGIGINCGEMNWLGRYEEGRSSEWLQKLAATEEADALGHIVSIYSQHDNIVSPQSSAHLEGAWNIPVIGIGHVALALEPSIHKMVIDLIHNAATEAHKARCRPAGAGRHLVRDGAGAASGCDLERITSWKRPAAGPACCIFSPVFWARSLAPSLVFS
jgi:triacylglycerol esterase/lipase EstA (alpha/beta hydrolase family)